MARPSARFLPPPRDAAVNFTPAFPPRWFIRARSPAVMGNRFFVAVENGIINWMNSMGAGRISRL